MSFATELAALLFAHDPIRINYGHNTDEYAPEADSIIARLPTATSEAEVLDLVFEEFERWFGNAGEKDGYREIARRTWELWQSHAVDERQSPAAGPERRTHGSRGLDTRGQAGSGARTKRPHATNAASTR